jgi:hypothetical protein
LCKEFPERFSLSASIKRAHEAGQRPCLGVIQNIADRIYYRHQFRPFCKALGIGRFQSVDPTGCVRISTYMKMGGHIAIPEVGMMEGMLGELLALRVGS